jgi:two-component system OmpR family sensor kinase
VSATTSLQPDRGRSRALFGVWLLVVLAASATLLFLPSWEIFAVEAVVLSFALLYGFGVWPIGPTVTIIVGFVTLAALVMFPRASDGDLPTTELVEIAVPALLAGVVIYHVRRREAAIQRGNELADENRRRAIARERLSRMTSHELRTPLTIARGYVDHLLTDEQDDERREDLVTVRDELDQVTRVTDRLVRAVALDLGAPDQETDVAAVLEDVRRRWSMVVDRVLTVECTVDSVPVNAARLRAALDTLVENSVRYTCTGHRIRLFAVAVDGRVEVGVADSGNGLSPELVAHVNEAADLGLDAVDDQAVETDAAARERLRDTYSQTGFGLRLVASIAQSAGGRLVASVAPEGGAQLAIVLAAAPEGHGGQGATKVTETVWDVDPDVPVRSSR